MHDAEDAVQETLLRAWRGPSTEEGYLAREDVGLAFVAALQRDALRELGDEAVAALVARWAEAWHAADVDAIVFLLTADARWSMPPLPEWFRGRDGVRALLLNGPLLWRWRFLPTTANGQVAFGTNRWDDDAGRYVPGGLDVLTVQGGGVSDVTAFLTADLTRFGLPADLGA